MTWGEYIAKARHGRWTPADVRMSARNWGVRGFDAARANFSYMLAELCPHFRIDLPIGIFIVIYLALLVPTLPRNLENPQAMAAYSNDEPFLTMALEATLHWPPGNPANYFDTHKAASETIPAYWSSMRYPGFHYYGGALYQLTFPEFAILRTVGLPPFPTGPLLLRGVCLFGSLGALLLMYNLAKARGWRMAGLLAATYMATSPDFLYYVVYIHPDTLQMLFAMCAFVFAVAHAKRGCRASLFGLGFFCGLVQGTKVGGPWLVPMALLALWLGWNAWSARPVGAKGSDVARAAANRLGLLFGASLIGFFVSTPYAFIDPYYFRSLLNTLKAVSADNLQQKVSVLTWAEAVYSNIGAIGASLVALTAVRALASVARGKRDPALLLGVTAALSQFLWFGLLSKVWVIVGYLIFAFGIMAVFSFETLLSAIAFVVARLTQLVSSRAWPARLMYAAAALVLFCGVLDVRWYRTSWMLLDLHLSKFSTVRETDAWAKQANIPPNAKIIFDDLAYFDRARFPNAKMYGGVLTWPAVRSYQPEYIALSSSLYDAPWYQNLRATQKLERFDPNPFNVRLYQDLLSSKTSGPTKAPGIELEHVFEPSSALLSIPESENNLSNRAMSYCLRSLGLLCQNPMYNATSLLAQTAQVEHRVRVLMGEHTGPLVGPEIRLFHVTSRSAFDGAQ